MAQRWRGLPYVKSAFSSTDFADLAESCAALFGSPVGQAASSSNVASSSGSGAMDAASGIAPQEGAAAQLPDQAAEMLDEIAYEVSGLRVLGGRLALN